MNLHDFFFFLGTTQGELLRKSIESILFILVTYMVISEFTRSRKRELKYLAVAFASLAMQRLMITYFLANIIFGDFTLETLNFYIPVIGDTVELFALLLLANAFVYPLFKGKTDKLRNLMKLGIILLIILFFIFEFSWINNILLYPETNYNIYWVYAVFSILKIIVLSFPIILIFFNPIKGMVYKKSIVIAFLVYLVVPILEFLNFFVFNNDQRIDVAQHPFPFISVMLFTRVVYLKLVDKAVLRDKLKLSERKYKEEKEISRMKDEFISTVSHEFRTPLTSMGLYASLLKNEKLGSLNKKQKKALDIIKQENKRLAQLINDILDLSRLESGVDKLKIQKFNLGKLCRDNIYYSLAKKKGIKIINKVPSNFYVNVDIDKFKQLFINLISNAIKYTDKGGIITVITSNNPDKWKFSVSDTGKGIKKEDLVRLFDKFHRIDDYMTKKERGIGLGLAIVKKIVDMHKGEIKVDTKLGKGSTFTVIMPKDY
jgi:signal transduction histidine kinase